MIEKSHTAKQGFGKSGADVFQVPHLSQALIHYAIVGVFSPTIRNFVVYLLC